MFRRAEGQLGWAAGQLQKSGCQNAACQKPAQRVSRGWTVLARTWLLNAASHNAMQLGGFRDAWVGLPGLSCVGLDSARTQPYRMHPARMYLARMQPCQKTITQNAGCQIAASQIAVSQDVSCTFGFIHQAIELAGGGWEARCRQAAARLYIHSEQDIESGR